MVKQSTNLIQADIEIRNKELACLYQVDDILSDYDKDLSEILAELIKIIPHAWSLPKICEVAIHVDNVNIQSKHFVLTHLKMNLDIISEGRKRGNITLVYTKPIRNEKGVFTSGEFQLLKTIASKISAFLLYKQLRNTINHLQNQEKVQDKPNADQEVIDWLLDNDLTEEEISNIMKVKIEFGKGETICKQGAIASYIILLTEGLSKNYLEGYQERGFNFKIIKPMDFIGLSSLYGNNLYAFSGSALTKCDAYLVDSQLMKNIISTNSKFANRVMTWYCQTTQGHLQRMSSIANKQSLGRLAETILYLSNTIFEGDIITNNVSRKDIAELAAISTESAVRFLSDFKKDGVIRILPNRIEILKKEVLEMISNS
jgi:CRP/FNR family transcriptional regulator